MLYALKKNDKHTERVLCVFDSVLPVRFREIVNISKEDGLIYLRASNSSTEHLIKVFNTAKQEQDF